MPGRHLIRHHLAITISLTLSAATHAGDNPFLDMDLAELANVRIVSATNTEESLRDAPATVIVLTQDDLQRRGYRNLSEIYDDLPGMDISRAYGDNFFINYWRGLRKNIGVAYLIMIDGVTFNHLYFHQAEIFAAFPMSNIDHIEVVYGPASATYGANAFVGVINVITRKQADKDGHSGAISLRKGSFGTQIVDGNYFYQHEDMRMSLTLRQNKGHLDTDSFNRYEWTENHYRNDATLWGDFLNMSQYRDNESPYRTTALDARWMYQGTEVAAQYFELDSGYGREYAADAVQNGGHWIEPDLSLYVRHHHEWFNDVNGTTLLRYRESGVDPHSDFLEGYPNKKDSYRRLVDYSYWASDNSSYQLQQDFAWKVAPNWHISGGLSHEKSDLQKNYNVNYGPSLNPDNIDLDTYAFPATATHDTVADNHFDARHTGIHALARYTSSNWFGNNNDNVFTLGGRYDDSSTFSHATTIRGGYVGHYGAWTGKALYGEAFNAPSPRLLYGGWKGSGSNPNLQPETGKSYELSLNYTDSTLSALISAYHLRTENDFLSITGGAINQGGSEVQGLDVHLKQVVAIPVIQKTGLWGYYSYTNATDGDIAMHKLHAGLDMDVDERWSFSLRSRYFGSRATISTNPVREVGRYTVTDINAIHKIPGSPYQISLAVTNLFDAHYDQPGVRSANAGDTPGYWDSNGIWQGSKGFYSSLLVQEGRGLLLTLDYKLK